MADKGIDLSDILMIGAVAGGGYILYKAVSKKNTVVINPDKNWDQVNGIIDKLGQQNNAFLGNIMQILGKNPGNSDGSNPDNYTPAPLPPGGGSSGGGSSGGGSSGGGSSGGNDKPLTPDEEPPTIDNVKESLDWTNAALDKLGYSGIFAQSNALLEESYAENEKEVAESPVLNALENTMTHDTGNKVLDKVSNAFNPLATFSPVNVKNAWDNIHGFGEYLYNKLTGKKNVDDELAVL